MNHENRQPDIVKSPGFDGAYLVRIMAPGEVALIDLNLPDQNGSELIEKIHAVAPNLPIVPLSGVSSNAVLESANRVCCDGYTIEIDLLNWISCSSVSMTPLRANRPERSQQTNDEPA